MEEIIQTYVMEDGSYLREIMCEDGNKRYLYSSADGWSSVKI